MPITIRNLTIGSGRPKIAVPIAAENLREIRSQAKIIRDLPADLVEWRVDWFDEVFDPQAVRQAILLLRNEIGGKPLLMTFRSLKEGGKRAIDAKSYEKLYVEALQSGLVDAIDVELFMGDQTVLSLIEKAHRHGSKVVVSSHDFKRTPKKEEILRRIQTMCEMGADLPKIAVMPQCPEDVLTLLEATQEASKRFADKPIVTMSMGREGLISRISGGIFGSAMTFGAASRASALGQIDVLELDHILSILYS